MSAITGILQFNQNDVSIRNRTNIMDSLAEFPVNHIGCFHKNHIYLGCHSQWITKESLGEKLPFYDPQRQIAITADAIIDNRLELFEHLQVPLRDQKNITDSQLIMLAYLKWGQESPKYLIGDFAFMIWDEKQNLLFGARDFSGSRTLYYSKSGSNFAFSTTIKPLLSLSFIDKKLNKCWLADYLAVSGMMDSVDPAITPYMDIYQIPPAHSLTLKNDKITIRRYHSFSNIHPFKFKNDSEYVEAFQSEFQQAVTARLRTYKKIGAQLSGGLDSGSVVSYAVNSLKEKREILHTFSYIPPNDFEDFTATHLLTNETPLIKKTVQHVNGIHAHLLSFDKKNSYDEIDDFLSIMEMPYKFFENSFWLKGLFEAAHSEGAGVLLNGDRGNFSISWGSAVHYYSELLKKLKWVKLYKELNQYSRNTGGARLGQLPDIAKIAFPGMFIRKTENRMPSIINESFAEEIMVNQKLAKQGINHRGWYLNSSLEEERIKHFEDGFHWNASNTLSTKLSLKYSLWKRDPTNDLRVIRFCLSVPNSQYVQNGLDRALIRRATKNYLPDEVRLNQRTFGVQGADWVYRMIPQWNEFRHELDHLVKDDQVMYYLNRDTIMNALSIMDQGVESHHAINPYFKILVRTVILYRFLKKFN
ncbi:asparagine synthase-related protein [Metabacillus sp. 84]|uniref:asparagine synthase-related protein n=1 Tax=unclassified Metabacillus TaxID=2675274 RepID=UPI003CE7FFC1